MNDRCIYLRNWYFMNKNTIIQKQKEWRIKNKEYVNDYMREYMRIYRLNQLLKKKCRINRGMIKLEPRKPYFLKFENKTTTINFD